VTDIVIDPNSQKVMAAIDKMKPAMRALVHEYGFLIVHNMIADGYRDPVALRPLLETWRQRRQEALLSR
jgi:hypothetical protein